jgi:hypothetical protein
MARHLLLPLATLGAWWRARQIHCEDNAAVEQLQTNGVVARRQQPLSIHETRIARFEEDHVRLVADAAPSPGSPRDAPDIGLNGRGDGAEPPAA